MSRVVEGMAAVANREAWLPGDVHVWIGTLSLVERAADWQLLDAAERQRAASFREGTVSRAFIARRAEAKRILARYCHCSPHDLVMTKGAFGKPLLPQISFNWSKTRQYWALAVTPAGQIGIDIERIALDVDWEDLLPILCHPTELEFITSDKAMARRRFFQIWARKEAFLKATGIGLSGDLASITVLPSAASSDAKGHVDGVQDVIDLSIETGIAGALAVDFPVGRLLSFEQSMSPNKEIMWDLRRSLVAA